MGKKIIPNYEVKLLMKPEVVLNHNNELISDVIQEFHVKEDKSYDMAIQFVDTPDQVIQKANWNLRVRRSQGKDTFGLTWKKRIPIDVNAHPDPAKNIDVAVDAAFDQGFDKSTGFETQVETGYKSQTLSISYNEEVSGEGYTGMQLPSIEDSCKLLMTKAPGQFTGSSMSTQRSGSGGPLAETVLYGPVHAKRYVGKWNGNKLYIEVWPIRTSKADGTMIQVVEASFKVDETKDAIHGRDQLAKDLDKKGWFVAEDSLKTGMIMSRYPPSS